MKALLYSFQALLFLLLFSGALTAYGYEFTGAEITYSRVSDSTYRFQVMLFSKCEQPEDSLPDTAFLCYTNGCTGSSGYIVLSRQVLPLGQPQAPDFKQYLFAGDFTLFSRCENWQFYTAVPGRNNAVNLNAVSDIYLEALLNNLDGDTVSAIHYPAAPSPVAYLSQPGFALNVPYTNSNDSMVSSLIPPHTAAPGFFSGCVGSAAPVSIGFMPGQTFNNPFAGPWPAAMNPATGTLSFFLPLTGSGYNNYTVKTDLYKRTGQWKGAVMRDVQIKGTDGSLVGTTGGIDPASVWGCQPDTNFIHFNAMVNVPFGFCAFAHHSSNTPLQFLSMTASSADLPVIAQLSYQSQDSCAVCVTYTPQLSDTGMKLIKFTVKDSFNTTGYCDEVNTLDVAWLSYLRWVHISLPNSVGEISGSTKVNWFPNPAKGSLKVLTEAVDQTVILSMNGATLIKTRDNLIDISGLSDGLYLLRFFDRDGSVLGTEKMVKVQGN
ncbi:MAG: T9SS type A sorting domain-containing protein [Sphingobacteriales bacterium]|nr:MAG: T9SS type A sorting domain-containing protein [Sphingobacteriales bacterium]